MPSSTDDLLFFLLDIPAVCLLLLVHTSDFLLVLLVESLLALLHLALVDLTQLVQRFLHSVLVFPFCKKTWIKAAVPREVRQLVVCKAKNLKGQRHEIFYPRFSP